MQRTTRARLSSGVFLPGFDVEDWNRRFTNPYTGQDLPDAMHQAMLAGKSW
jgi:RecJ-like exonuclease